MRYSHVPLSPTLSGTFLFGDNKKYTRLKSVRNHNSFHFPSLSIRNYFFNNSKAKPRSTNQCQHFFSIEQEIFHNNLIKKIFILIISLHLNLQKTRSRSSMRRSAFINPTLQEYLPIYHNEACNLHRRSFIIKCKESTLPDTSIQCGRD